MLDKTQWHPGMNPEQHPYWDRQVELEVAMLKAGRERFTEAVRVSSEKRRMTTVRPVRKLMIDWLPRVVDGIREWLRDTRTNSRRTGSNFTPVSARLLRSIDPHLAAYVTLRTVLDKLGAERVAVLTIAKEIGLALEHEARMDAWEKRDPGLFMTVQRGFKGGPDTPSASATHRRRVNIHRFNALMREELEWRDWSEDERQRLGLDLVDILIRYTKRFEMVPDPAHVARRGKKEFPQYVLAPTADLLEWLVSRLDHFETLYPMYMPTVIPPRRWSGMREGGYHTPHLRTPALIRFKAHQEQQRGNAEQEYDSIDMPLVYEALHVLQETPWRVNSRVFEVAKSLWTAKVPIAGLPSQDGPIMEPELADETEEERKARRRRNTTEHARFIKRASSIKLVKSTLEIAERYLDEPTLYFPHMLDFRGRIYPIPVALQPQGDDLARGLLTFAEGRPITEESGGAGWLAIHLANCFGKDKISNDERIAWVEANEEMFRRIAEDPLAHRHWCMKGVDHFQALAAVFEWVGFLDEGFGFLSRLPIRVDGTCNGIQHLSALIRDEVGGAAVNLIPSETPRDIYKEVSEPLTLRLREISEGLQEDHDKADWWLRFVGTDGFLPRSLTKRPVMIVPYGGSREAHFKYTREWLDENYPEIVRDISEQERSGVIAYGTIGRLVAFLVKHMAAEIEDVVARGVEVMKWLQKCAKFAAQGNQPIYWETPAGFVVRHFYGKTKMRRITTKLDGRTVQMAEQVRTKDLDVKEQLSGIAPNFIHSLDASALMSAIVLLAENGVTSVTSIHDAYGTHAADMWTLHKALRRAFVETHTEDVLGNFRKACVSVLATHIIVTENVPEDMEWAAYQKAESMVPQPPSRGSLDIADVEESDYFFS